MAEVVIRPSVLGDAEEIERLRVAGWMTAYRGIIPDAFLDSMSVDVERRRRLMADWPGLVTEAVAVHDGVIAGWVVAVQCRDDDRTQPWQGEVHGCYVHPEWWGRGIGGRLLAYAAEALEAAGRPDITLWVLEENYRARRFYESHGFQPDGKRKILDLGAPVTEVRYRRACLSPPPG